mgnify:CR=1 FL=1
MSFQNRNLQIDEACSLTKPVIGRGENPGHLENRPKSVLDFGEFWGSTRYRSKSVEGRPVLVGFRQLTELEPRLAGGVVLECGITRLKISFDVKQFVGRRRNLPPTRVAYLVGVGL